VARSDAATPEAYIAEQGPDRASDLARVRNAVNAAMPEGYVERMSWGMISWEVPLEVSGATYNKQPLVYAALAAQKNYNALYLNCTYASPERTARLREAFMAAGKKLDMGKSCIRFKRAADLALDAILEEIRTMGPQEFAQANRR
jgi:uncharacterized protein YdhG (YjbR/CyaY superfamily)